MRAGKKIPIRSRKENPDPVPVIFQLRVQPFNFSRLTCPRFLPRMDDLGINKHPYNLPCLICSRTAITAAGATKQMTASAVKIHRLPCMLSLPLHELRYLLAVIAGVCRMHGPATFPKTAKTSKRMPSLLCSSLRISPLSAGGRVGGYHEPGYPGHAQPVV